jgi:hypothetical protein
MICQRCQEKIRGEGRGRTSNIERRTSNVEGRGRREGGASNVEHRTSRGRIGKSKIKNQRAKIQCKMQKILGFEGSLKVKVENVKPKSKIKSG